MRTVPAIARRAPAAASGRPRLRQVVPALIVAGQLPLLVEAVRAGQTLDLVILGVATTLAAVLLLDRVTQQGCRQGCVTPRGRAGLR